MLTTKLNRTPALPLFYFVNDKFFFKDKTNKINSLMANQMLKGKFVHISHHSMLEISNYLIWFFHLKASLTVNDLSVAEKSSDAF